MLSLSGEPFPHKGERDLEQSFFLALLGALIGGGETMWAQFISINSQRKQEKDSEKVLIHGFVQAIADEVASVRRTSRNVEPPNVLETVSQGVRAVILWVREGSTAARSEY